MPMTSAAHLVNFAVTAEADAKRASDLEQVIRTLSAEKIETRIEVTLPGRSNAYSAERYLETALLNSLARTRAECLSAANQELDRIKAKYAPLMGQEGDANGVA